MRFGVSWTIVVMGAVLALMVQGSSAPGQSLAEVARREQERRKQIKTPAKVYTNEDLKRGSGRLTTAVPQPAAGQSPAGSKAEGAAQDLAGAAGQPEQPSPQTKDEAYWRDRMTAARDELARARLFLEALQSRVNALWADFTARDDPAQRAIIERDRLKALAEMDRVKMEIAGFEKAIAEIEDEARRAGVPPGWLR